MPIHPGRMWCHCRQVYLPMSWIYGQKLSCPLNSLIEELRCEIFLEDFQTINWSMARNYVAESDLYSPHSWILNVTNVAMKAFEYLGLTTLRQKALDEVLDHIKAEDFNTDCIGIGPVSKAVNLLVRFYSDGIGSDVFKTHCERVNDYLWFFYSNLRISHDGMKLQGTNGSQVWDTEFAIQALLESILKENPSVKKCIGDALKFLDAMQIKENTVEKEKFYRHANKGGFPFSTRDCGWIVTDCTAEALKSIMLARTIQYSHSLILESLQTQFLMIESLKELTFF